MDNKQRDTERRTFKTWQELWHTLTDRDFDEVYENYKKSERCRKLGMYYNRKLREAANLIRLFLKKQKRYTVLKPLELTRKKYPDPLPNPKDIKQIWGNLTDMDYDLAYQLHCQYAKGFHNDRTRRGAGLIARFRQYCKLAGFDYPKKDITVGFKPNKNHPWGQGYVNMRTPRFID